MVDDTIIYDESYDEHISNVRKFLTKCRENGITLNKDKFKFAESEVKFVGYVVSGEGIGADPDKLEANSSDQEVSNAYNDNGIEIFHGNGEPIG